ncbi:MAG: BspA family leucine-rich repeat surface protein [bacterium]|nr:BspA family leucine-rich repeat surface protein [bacterium]
MKKLNEKGFTLIELLAVIVIISILMMIAIPSVSRIIEKSRIDSFVTTAKAYVNAAKNLWTADSLTCGNNNTYVSGVDDGDYYILIDTSDDTISPLIEKNSKSPWGGRDLKGYVRITKAGDGDKVTKYYVALTDGTHAIYDDVFNPIESYQLDRNDVINDITKESKKLKKIQTTPFEINKYTTCSEESVTWTGTSSPYKDSYEPKTEGVAYALFSETDNSLTFVRSEAEIKPGDVYEGIKVTKVYTGFERADYHSSDFVPWHGESRAIRKIEVRDIIKPISTAHWFYEFEYCSDVNVANLDTSNVTNMRSMFRDLGYYGEDIYLDLSGFNTSNVTYLPYIFMSTGYKAKNITIDLTGWNTSKITDMSDFFWRVGEYATTVNIIGIEDFDTSKVTNMSSMFYAVGENATTLNLGDLSKWDTSNVTNMESMFCKTGYNASFSLDLSNWNVNNVTRHGSFNYNVSYKIKSPIWVN